MDKPIDKITDVLLFKDRVYWLTIMSYKENFDGTKLELDKRTYSIVPKDWDINNGFEFASDAYSYLTHLGSKLNKQELL